jgi:hypothetical protein
MDECGDIRTRAAVVGGTRGPSTVPLTPGQVAAIGSLSGCTGVLLDQRWVLSSSRCSIGPSTTFCMGRFSSGCVSVRRAIIHPLVDLALVELSADASSVAPGVEPLSYAIDLPRGWIGHVAEAAGYGQSDTGAGSLFFTAERIVDITDATVVIDGNGRQGLCHGDIGAPLMVTGTDGKVYVIGTLSNGDESCVGQDVFTRVDVGHAWIVANAVDEGAEVPCGQTTEAGSCTADGAVWCEDGRLMQAQCDDCAYDTERSAYRCPSRTGEPPREDACAGLSNAGMCQGDVARWCEGGVVLERDCRRCGQGCAMDDAAGGAHCTAAAVSDSDAGAGSTDGCGAVDALGRCDRSTAEWCENGSLRRQDCAAEGLSCGWRNDTDGFRCI